MGYGGDDGRLRREINRLIGHLRVRLRLRPFTSAYSPLATCIHLLLSFLQALRSL